jgi:hypothetical protein
MYAVCYGQDDSAKYTRYHHMNFLVLTNFKASKQQNQQDSNIEGL